MIRARILAVLGSAALLAGCATAHTPAQLQDTELAVSIAEAAASVYADSPAATSAQREDIIKAEATLNAALSAYTAALQAGKAPPEADLTAALAGLDALVAQLAPPPAVAPTASK